MNDHILWRDLDSLLHERAVLVGGPQLSWCMGGPKVLGGPNLVGGPLNPVHTMTSHGLLYSHGPP